MNLRTSSPLWLVKNGLIQSYPSLDKDVKADVVVMGAGISGALTSWYLCREGFNVVVVDRRTVGTGSTAASTSLLQYEIDTPLRHLINLVGYRNAVRSYLLGIEAIDELAGICQKVRHDDFRSRQSFQYASSRKDAADLKEEYILRKACGIKLQWLEDVEIRKKYGFDAPAGVLSNAGADVDAYGLTHAIFKHGAKLNLQLYDKTAIRQIVHHRKGVELLSSSGYKIKARTLIIACGYESQNYIPRKVQDLDSTYAIASEPLDQKNFWYKNSLIWETAEPYLYLRTTSDNRIIIGGKDDPFQNSKRRDAALPKKARALERSFYRLFPAIPFKTDFQWAGTFASTKDGLPYIGTIRQRPNTYFALGFGGNGITFSVLAGKFISEMMVGKNNPDAEIFSFDR